MPQADELAHGRRQWQRAWLAGRRRPRVLALAGIAAAASLLMAIGWRGWQVFRTTPTTHGIPVQIAVGPDSSANGVPKAHEERMRRASNGYATPIAELSGPPHDDPAAGNGSIAPATARWQRLRVEMILARSQATWQSKEDELLDRTVAQRMVEPGGDLQQLVEPLMPDRAEYERLLLARLDALVGRQELAAIEVLGCIGSEASVPRLVYLSLKPAVHLPAIRALLAIADGGTLAWLAHDEPDPGLQGEILAALQSRGDEQAQFFVLTQQGARPCFDCGLDWRQQWDLP
jgi:hypothetical protein